MTFLGTLVVFMAFFLLVGVGVIVTKKTFRGCGCKNTLDESMCCKKEECEEDCSTKDSQPKNN